MDSADHETVRKCGIGKRNKTNWHGDSYPVYVLYALCPGNESRMIAKEPVYHVIYRGVLPSFFFLVSRNSSKKKGGQHGIYKTSFIYH